MEGNNAFHDGFSFDSTRCRTVTCEGWDRLYLTDNRNLGIRGLLPYRSSFNARARGDTRDALSSQRVYRLKSAGESAATWRALILAAKDDLQCGAVWAVPSHLPGTINSLQSIFGATIRRVKETVPRKYDHAAP
ncbi:MAG TPA: hypothetical protein PLY73_15925, partial [Candidatus Ozemobacteraceae bacterium]|nr:hypothetical protein [Candidatus Ozemobacteraceae bacterium]